MQMAIAAVVPHYLIGLAGGAALLGTFMPVCGYIIPIDELPDPVWRYPVHYIAYHTYAVHGMLVNEFEGTDGWACPCELLPGGCEDKNCTTTGKEVRRILRNTLALCSARMHSLRVLNLHVAIAQVGVVSHCFTL